MNRRRFVRIGGVLIASTTTGCADDLGLTTKRRENESVRSPIHTSSPTGATIATSTPRETPTPTRSPTPISASTPTPAESNSRVEHGFDEPFTVGTGDNKIGYRVVEVTVTPSIGSPPDEIETDGTFIIPRLKVSNEGVETVQITTDHILVSTAEGTIYEADAEATNHLSNDDDFSDAKQILSAKLAPETSVTANLAFEVPKGNRYVLLFNPAGILRGERFKHVVEIGRIE